MLRPPSKGRTSTQPFVANFRRLFGAHTVSNLGDGIGLVAYPWLASTLTRDPVLISGVLIAQRLPWLLFSLPVGVVVDRMDRRNLMVGADAFRAALTAIVAVAVLRFQADLPSPDLIASVVEPDGIPNRLLLFAALLATLFLLGIGEVIHDTAAMTILPQIVDRSDLPSANGTLSSAEQAANLFFGPPLGALLLSGAFVLPFLVDASSFALSAAILLTLALKFERHDDMTTSTENLPGRFRRELIGGYRALRSDRHVTLFAVVTTVMNLTAGMIFSIMVFFAQDVLKAGPGQFSTLTVGSAAGSVAGGLLAAKLAKGLGLGLVLRTAALAMGLSLVALGFTASWYVAAILLASYGLWLIVWAANTTSFRQAVTANEVLGRVNGVYRFFTYGAIPVGALLSGLVVAVVETGQTRETALRTPVLIAGTVQLLVSLAAAPRLNSRLLERARLAAQHTSGVQGSDIDQV